ncbi:MAG: DNA-binding protein [Alistipes indistinctus]|nr:DNA-binding protein [Alistipes indistinctus]MBD9135448.1 DNA-binding protein [Alistipes indistinctus]
MLNISTRALQSYRDNGIIGYTYVGRKCLYKPDEIKTMLDDTLKSKCNV